MEKEELLLENYKELKENLVEFNRNLVFVCDIYNQKFDEIKENIGKNFFNVENGKLYIKSLQELDELKQKIKNCFEDFNFNSSFDIYKTFLTIFETLQSDLFLINSYPLSQSFIKNNVDEVFLFNLENLSVVKIQTKIMLENLDVLINKTNNLAQKIKKF